jgi:hypothetical protein
MRRRGATRSRKLRKGWWCYLVIVNHTTGGRYFNDKQLYHVYAPAVGGLQILYIFLTCWLILPIVMLALTATAFRVNRSRFKRSGVEPLVTYLNHVARSA